jgi:hypothetical protein
MTTAGAAKRQFDDIQGVVRRVQPSPSVGVDMVLRIDNPSSGHRLMPLRADVGHAAAEGWQEVAEDALSWAQAQVQTHAGGVRIAPEAIWRGQVSTEAQVWRRAR